MKPVELIIAGAGDRGFVYASYAKVHPKRAKIVGVAEPREFYREGEKENLSSAETGVAGD